VSKRFPLCNGTPRSTHGQVLVYTTIGSTYLVDYDGGTVTRYPGTGVEPVQPVSHPDDWQEVRFDSVTYDIDEPMVFVVIRDGSPAELVTSPLHEVAVFPNMWLPAIGL